MYWYAFCLCTLGTNSHFSNNVHFLKFVQCNKLIRSSETEKMLILL
jgi:hypothetical protein